MHTDPLCPQQHTHPKHDPDRCIFCEYGAAAREGERGKALADMDMAAYLLGQRDERERIRTGVTGLYDDHRNLLCCDCRHDRDHVLAVIDGGESNGTSTRTTEQDLAEHALNFTPPSVEHVDTCRVYNCYGCAEIAADDAEHAAELEFASLHEEGLA